MASPVLCLSQFSLKINYKVPDRKSVCTNQRIQNESCHGCLNRNWSFTTGSRVLVRPPQFATFYRRPKISAAWLSPDQIATNAFTLSTISVLPCYSLMFIAPKSKLTKRLMESSVPYVILALVYAYVLHLSWTPDTLRLIYSSKYFLPELGSISKLFSSDMSLSSAWVHILGVDLFAARQVFMDGLEEQIESRHSVILCLLFCPIGILSHVITKELIKRTRNSH